MIIEYNTQKSDDDNGDNDNDNGDNHGSGNDTDSTSGASENIGTLILDAICARRVSDILKTSNY